MASKAKDILKEIGHLIFLVENSRIEKVAKFKTIKVLLAVKLKFFELLNNDLKTETNSPASENSIIKPQSGQTLNEAARGDKDSEKHGLILRFIKNNGGRVDSAQLAGLGIAGRSLRRYIKVLRDSNKIKTEKSGRNLFYLTA